MPSTSDEKRQSWLAAFRNTDRIAGISCGLRVPFLLKERMPPR